MFRSLHSCLYTEENFLLDLNPLGRQPGRHPVFCELGFLGTYCSGRQDLTLALPGCRMLLLS